MTTITTYAIAWGGKFIGQGQSGVAKFTVTDAQGNIIHDEAGNAIQQVPITEGGAADGSGVTQNIMTFHAWGFPINTTGAFSYTFSFQPAAPMQLTFTVEVWHYDELKSTASIQQMVWPGLDLSGAASVVVVVPGLLTDVVLPTSPYVVGKAASLSANVYMMCGCQIDNNNWPGGNFNVEVHATYADGSVDMVELYWESNSLFTADWSPSQPGLVTLQSFVVETINGNTAFSQAAQTKVLP